MKNVLSLTKKLISIPSVYGDLGAMSQVLGVVKRELGGFGFVEFERDGVRSLIFSNKDSEFRKFEVILNAHLDVIKGNSEQFEPFERDGRLYGRGAYDMKAAAAVMILLFKEIAMRINYPLGLQITTDEEVGGANCTKYQMERGVRGKFVITGEGTDLTIVNESKTRMQFKLVANGKSSHGAYPWRGENAILKMQGAIYKLNEVFPVPKEEYSGTTFNVTLIKTNNETFNMTPDHCEAVLDARVTPEDRDNIKERVKEVVGDDIVVETVHESGVHFSDRNCVYVKRLANVVEGVTGMAPQFRRAHGESDARFHGSVGSEAVEFGPVGANHHGDEEWVDVRSLFDYYEILKRFLLEQ